MIHILELYCVYKIKIDVYKTLQDMLDSETVFALQLFVTALIGQY